MFEKIVSAVNNIVWSPALVVLLVGAGLYFSIRTRFVQLRRFGLMTRLLFRKKDNDSEKKGVSSFEAFCIALSGRVGTGNIVGVATAIALGGPGAIFWMWIIAFFGASTA
ncbi:MAG: sodium:alanine symporter family protein [Bacteroidales bacterium]|nr:sodium:alanine symporter family protein [Bacteroidales bacterium]